MASKTTKPTTRTKKAKEPSVPKPVKPVFRAGTWITLLVLAAVIGAAYYLKNNPLETAEADTTPTGEAAFLFESDSVVTSIEITPFEGDPVKLERDEANVWALTQPTEAEADQGLSEAAASQVTVLSISSEIEGDPSIFGFDEPTYVITVGFEGGDTGTLEVGTATPTNSGYYVRLNGDKMFIVPMAGIDSLTNLLVFPPYLSTPVPEIEVTPTP